MGVAIRGAILITAKMAPQRQKIKLQWISKVPKCHPGFLGGIFGNFGERMDKLQNSGWWLLYLSTAIFHPIFDKFNYIF